MRIAYLQVSNVLSFRFFPDISNAEKIVFDAGLNIIIGENGAGKSTILEIINFIFRRVIYKHFVINRDLFERRRTLDVGDRRQMLTAANLDGFRGFRLEPNWDSENKEQRIRIALNFDGIDEENILNIHNHYELICSTTSRYSSHSAAMIEQDIGSCLIDVVLNKDTQSFTVQHPTIEQGSGLSYLTSYHFFKEAIALHNALEPGQAIPPLLESFTLISSYRNYHAFQPSISLSAGTAAHQIQQIVSQDYSRSLNAMDSSEPLIFALVRLQVAERHFDLMDVAISPQERQAQANATPLITAINQRLRVVNLRCQIQLTEMRTWQYSFHFLDTRRGRPVSDINSLSAGQKAIIHLVLEAYGRGEVRGGVIIIDEPEIHLHYQFQHEYLQVIRDLNTLQSCQYILVTHSEALINSSTIHSVRRFAIGSGGYTEVHSPTLSASEKSLIQILDNTRSTYAFFARRVVLVEGETDRYFIRAALRAIYPDLDQEIAVLHISGKTGFPKWRALFQAFGLTVSTIADFDYLANLHYATEPSSKLQTPEAIAKFKELHPDWETHINSEYENRTFILKEGDLEAYTNARKSLDEVIRFCRDGLSAFLDSSSSKSIEVRSVLARLAG